MTEPPEGGSASEAQVAKLVNAEVFKTSGRRLVGSIPTLGTISRAGWPSQVRHARWQSVVRRFESGPSLLKTSAIRRA